MSRISFLFAFSFFLMAASSLSAVNKESFDSIVAEIEDVSFSDGKKGKELLGKLATLDANEPADKKKQALYLYCESIVKNVQGENDTTLIPRIKACLNSMSDNRYFFERALLHYSLSFGYISKGDYGEAFTSALRSLEQFEHQSNGKFIGKTLMLLGNICYLIKSYSMADDYYSKASRLVKPPQNDYYHLCLNRYSLLTYTKGFQTAKDSLTSFVPVVKASGNWGILASTYTNLAELCRATGDLAGALQYFNRVRDILNKFDNKRTLVSLYQGLGFYYTNTRDFKQAEKYFRNSKAIALENHNNSQLFQAYYGLAYMYEKSNVIDSAFLYLDRCYVLRDQLSLNPKTIEAYQAYVSMLLESSEKELKIAEQELALKNRRLAGTIISTIALAFLAALLLIVVQQKKKIKEAENRDLEKRLQHELEIQKLQTEKIESQIREITSYSLLLSNKNHVLQQISEVTKHRPEDQQEAEEEREKINRIIKNNLHTDSDWNDFMIHFDKVHPQFFNKLKAICPDLTENNLRMCAYFRIGMSTKQIAQILNILPNAVRKVRFRLKKKFGLLEEDDFNNFIRNI